MVNSRSNHKELLYLMSISIDNPETKSEHPFDGQNSYAYDTAAFKTWWGKLNSLPSNTTEVFNPATYEKLFIEFAREGYITEPHLAILAPSVKDIKAEPKTIKSTDKSIIQPVALHKAKLLKLYGDLFRIAASLDFMDRLELEDRTTKLNINTFKQKIKYFKIVAPKIDLPIPFKDLLVNAETPSDQILLINKQITEQKTKYSAIIKNKTLLDKKIKEKVKANLSTEETLYGTTIVTIKDQLKKLEQDVDKFAPKSLSLSSDDLTSIQKLENTKRILLEKITEEKVQLNNNIQRKTIFKDNKQPNVEQIPALDNAPELSDLNLKFNSLSIIIHRLKEHYKALKSDILSPEWNTLPSIKSHESEAILRFLISIHKNNEDLASVNSKLILSIIREQYRLLWSTVWDNFGKYLITVVKEWEDSNTSQLEDAAKNKESLKKEIVALSTLNTETKQKLIKDINIFEDYLEKLNVDLNKSHQELITLLSVSANSAFGKEYNEKRWAKLDKMFSLLSNWIEKIEPKKQIILKIQKEKEAFEKQKAIQDEKEKLELEKQTQLKKLRQEKDALEKQKLLLEEKERADREKMAQLTKLQKETQTKLAKEIEANQLKREKTKPLQPTQGLNKPTQVRRKTISIDSFDYRDIKQDHKHTNTLTQPLIPKLQKHKNIDALVKQRAQVEKSKNAAIKSGIAGSAPIIGGIIIAAILFGPLGWIIGAGLFLIGLIILAVDFRNNVNSYRTLKQKLPSDTNPITKLSSEESTIPSSGTRIRKQLHIDTNYVHADMNDDIQAIRSASTPKPLSKNTKNSTFSVAHRHSKFTP